MQYIAFDSHKHYTLASVEAEAAARSRETKISHERGALRAFLTGCEPGSPVAVETIGNWYWIVDEIEQAGMEPRLVHARKAKLMMGSINKTDKLDARGLNRLQRNGTLPTVWIPPAEVRDRRDLPRTRMVLTRQRTQLKNRIHATLAKYALTVPGVSDIFGARGRERLKEEIKRLPPQTAYATARLLRQLQAVEAEIGRFEARMKRLFGDDPELDIVKILPGVGDILGVVIVTEIGTMDRFPSPGHFASYAGTTPRVHASGGRIRYGRLRPDVNRYLKWAFIEAANVVCMNRHRHPDRHVSRLYNRLVRRRGHQKAIGAVARHLAEATYWMLKKRQPYCEPTQRQASSTDR
ncbi:MAG: IS110 family transposase [Kiloniellaceae bacterium]